MTVAVTNNEPEWSLERRASKGFLVWQRDESKVRFRFEVEVLEYEKDPEEHKLMHENEPIVSFASSEKINAISHTVVVCATCVAALAVTLFVPWYLINSS